MGGVSMATGPTNEQLELVALHGSGPLERALALAVLASRRGCEPELRGLIDELVTEKVADGGTSRKPGANGAAGSGYDPQSTDETVRPPNFPHQGRETSLPEVKNVVTSGSLGQEIDIDAVGADIEVAEIVLGNDKYHTDKLCVRRHSDGPLLTLYRSGKYHIKGVGAVAKERELLDWTVKKLGQIGIGGLNVSFGVKNVVASANLDKPLDLTEIQRKLGYEHAEYDPEVDNALMYRPDGVDTVFRLYSTGRLMMYANATDEVNPSFEWLRDTL